MNKLSLYTAALILVLLLSAGPASAQQGDDTSICPGVFSGSRGNASKEDYPARYITPAQNNGDGTYTLSYGIISGRYMGSSSPIAAVRDCAFVDTNGNSQHDGGETLEAVSVPNAQFGSASSSSTRYVLTVTIAANPGDRVCDRAEIESSYQGTFVDKTQVYCETLPFEGEVPVSAFGVLGVGLLLGGALFVGQRVSRRRIIRA